MAKIKCFAVVEGVTDEATKSFGPLLVENKERKKILEQYCGAIDKIIDDISGDSIEVEVNEINGEISIAIGCEEIIVYPENKIFYDLTERALSLGFHQDTDSGSMVLKFVFPSIWERSF